MQFYILTIGLLVAAAQAWPQPRLPVCREIQVPVTVSVPRFTINATVDDNWDAAGLVFNLTRRDSGMAADPLPIVGESSGPVQSTYSVGVTLCGSGGPTLILTHGILESKLYWRPNVAGAEKYSFIDAAVAAGYSVLSYDRIGVGSSEKVNAYTDAQFPVEVAVLQELVAYARQEANASHVALVGHSYGAYISLAAAASERTTTSIDALVLTGFSGTFAHFGPFLAGAALRVARLQDPARWGALHRAYLTSADLFAATYVYFAQGYFEPHLAAWSYRAASEPFAVGELPSLLATPLAYDRVTAPVLLLQGQFDVSACGGNCVGVLDAIKGNFTSAKVVEAVDNLPAGHDLNLHKIAPHAFQLVFGFLKRHGM